jgi:hypothetical protein
LRVRGADALPRLVLENGVDVVLDLLRRLEVTLVRPIVFVLAVIGLVLAANLRPDIVDRAAVVRQQVLALGMDHQVPVAVFHKHGRSIVQQVPADEVEIPASLGRFDGQREIPAAFSRAVVAHVLTRPKILAFRLHLTHQLSLNAPLPTGSLSKKDTTGYDLFVRLERRSFELPPRRKLTTRRKQC